MPLEHSHFPTGHSLISGRKEHVRSRPRKQIPSPSYACLGNACLCETFDAYQRPVRGLSETGGIATCSNVPSRCDMVEAAQTALARDGYHALPLALKSAARQNSELNLPPRRTIGIRQSASAVVNFVCNDRIADASTNLSSSSYPLPFAIKPR